jgi:uncharacterized Tic20 family protein
MNVESDPQASSTPEVVAPVGDERTWALLGHLSALSAFISGLGCVIGPLIIWLIKRDTLPFAGDQAKEALNFNITILIAGAALVLFPSSPSASDWCWPYPWASCCSSTG